VTLCFDDALSDAVQSVDLASKWEDFGIGHYEYCGATGHDSREQLVVTEAKEVTLEWWEGEEHLGDWPEFEVKMIKTFHIGYPDARPVDVAVSAILQSALVTRQKDGSHRWSAVYLVGDE
jgi:hypothetical protein